MTTPTDASITEQEVELMIMLLSTDDGDIEIIVRGERFKNQYKIKWISNIKIIRIKESNTDDVESEDESEDTEKVKDTENNIAVENEDKKTQ